MLFKKIKQLKFNTVLLQTDSQESLCKTFIRFQEFYESPKFKNTIFTLGQLKHWYSITYGADTYHRDWEGFNFPSYVLKPFINGLFDPLTKEENELISLFRYRNDDFYIIGANDESTIRHELSHALYAYSKSYRKNIDIVCQKYDKKLNKIKKYLLDKGYCIDVLNDEIQAYTTDNDDDFIKENLDPTIVHKINKLYNSYYNETKSNRSN